MKPKDLLTAILTTRQIKPVFNLKPVSIEPDPDNDVSEDNPTYLLTVHVTLQFMGEQDIHVATCPLNIAKETLDKLTNDGLQAMEDNLANVIERDLQEMILEGILKKSIDDILADSSD